LAFVFNGFGIAQRFGIAICIVHNLSEEDIVYSAVVCSIFAAALYIAHILTFVHGTAEAADRTDSVGIELSIIVNRCIFGIQACCIFTEHLNHHGVSLEVLANFCFEFGRRNYEFPSLIVVYEVTPDDFIDDVFRTIIVIGCSCDQARSTGQSSYQNFIQIACGNFVTTNGTLGNRLAVGSAGRFCKNGACVIVVTGCGNNFLSNQNFAAIRAVLAFGDACAGAGYSNRFINDLSVDMLCINLRIRVLRCRPEFLLLPSQHRCRRSLRWSAQYSR